MKVIHHFIFVIVCLVIISCKKDTKTQPESELSQIPVTVIPFVEYRNSFVGIYTGYYSATQYSPPQYLPYVTYTTSVYTDTIAKDLSNDSNIISQKFGTFKINQYGKFYWSNMGSYKNLSFRNDSMLYTRHFSYGSNATSNTNVYKLKKQ